MTQRYACSRCHARVLTGTWSNAGFSVATAALLPVILTLHPRYTLQTVPPLFFVGIAGFVALGAFQAFKRRRFEQRHPR